MNVKNRLKLGSIGDEYVLGIICRMTNLTEHAKLTLNKLFDDDDRRTLFERGLDDARRCELADISSELLRLRRLNGKLFDRKIVEYSGMRVWGKIIKIIYYENHLTQQQRRERTAIREQALRGRLQGLLPCLNSGASEDCHSDNN